MRKSRTKRSSRSPRSPGSQAAGGQFGVGGSSCRTSSCRTSSCRTSGARGKSSLDLSLQWKAKGKVGFLSSLSGYTLNKKNGQFPAWRHTREVGNGSLRVHIEVLRAVGCTDRSLRLKGLIVRCAWLQSQYLISQLLSAGKHYLDEPKSCTYTLLKLQKRNVVCVHSVLQNSQTVHASSITKVQSQCLLLFLQAFNLLRQHSLLLPHGRLLMLRDFGKRVVSFTAALLDQRLGHRREPRTDRRRRRVVARSRHAASSLRNESRGRCFYSHLVNTTTLH